MSLPLHEIRASAMLLLVSDVGVPSSGVTVLARFVKISHKLSNLNDGLQQHSGARWAPNGGRVSRSGNERLKKCLKNVTNYVALEVKICGAVPWLRRLVASLLPRKLGFDLW